jgi:hypothetical protein
MIYRSVLFVVASVILSTAAHARILTIGSGGYSSLEAAAADALPGDTLMFLAGTHAGGAHVSNLQGTAENWITIMGDPSGTTLIEGGGNAFQLSDPAYVRITELEFDGQTANGVNIDDAGSFDTPAHDIVIEHCRWRGINATGNNDQLKLSGIDNFVVRNCDFRDGSPGGSMIDMVGCHFGRFEDNRFENAGSNCIQAKGGTHDILITRNRFYGGGQRAINIGGSTGLEFFRPQDADFEAKNIMVWANVFTGAIAPIAYVGAVRCAVINNTIFMPEKWAVRILQETTDARFQQCRENAFRNNIIILDDRADAPTFNIGPNTQPETFLFSHNLWYHSGDPSWSGPNTPASEQSSIIGQDPMLSAPALVDGDFTPRSGSPVIGTGVSTESLQDFLGQQFNSPPSIGAIEGNPPTSGTGFLPLVEALSVTVYPQPSRGNVHVIISGLRTPTALLEVYDASGRKLMRMSRGLVTQNSGTTATVRFDDAPAGLYFIVISDGASKTVTSVHLW